MMKSKAAAAPFALWMLLFTVVPLGIVLWFAFTNDAGQFMLIDSGANVECKPEYLQQFGIMGSVYMKNVMNLENPRVALANVGTEDTKGGELQQEAFRLLKEAPVNFVGNVEGREIPRNGADVVVADGFTGNLIPI